MLKRVREVLRTSISVGSGLPWVAAYGKCIILVDARNCSLQIPLTWWRLRHVSETSCPGWEGPGHDPPYFNPLLIVFTSVPWVSSPLNSQKNAPPSPWVFT